MDRKLVGLSVLFFVVFVSFVGYLFLSGNPNTSVTRASNINTTVSTNDSLVFAWPLLIPADGETQSTVTIFVRNSNGQGIPSKNISVSTTLGTFDVSTGVTNSEGRVDFTLTSSELGIAEVTAQADNLALSRSVTVEFE